ncbi:MAG: hypothetical protein LC637_05215 [Xanthomonadaceae bacterium]|nr:hypothetical protein [Xanthomonadaceae bacterium]
MKTRIAILLLAVAFFSTPGLAQEKAGQTPKDMTVIQDVLAGAASTTGSLVGGPVYDRIFTGDVQIDCTATSDFSGIGVGVEYASIAINSPTGATLVASLANPGTDISDTVLSLYCDPFDPANADQNLVAYNDDAGGLLSGFDGSEGIVLAPDTTYFLVVSLFSPAGIGGGNYELTVGGLNAGETVEFGPAGPTPPPVPESTPVPALSMLGMIGLLLLLATLAVVAIRRRAT